MKVTAIICKEQLEKFNPDLSVISVKDYGSDFLVTYLHKDDDTTPDPFLLINKKSGAISSYTIAEDLSRYYSTPNISLE